MEFVLALRISGVMFVEYVKTKIGEVNGDQRYVLGLIGKGNGWEGRWPGVSEPITLILKSNYTDTQFASWLNQMMHVQV